MRAGLLPRGVCCSTSSDWTSIRQVCAVRLLERVRSVCADHGLTCACADVPHHWRAQMTSRRLPERRRAGGSAAMTFVAVSSKMLSAVTLVSIGVQWCW